MNIYVVFQDGMITTVTTLPRIVQDELLRGSDTVELWRKEQRVRTFKNAKEFNRFVNPPRGEDEENGGGEYEW